MMELTPGTLWKAPEGTSCNIGSNNDTLELTRVERGPSGDVLALTFVPFVGEPIRLVLQPAMGLQCFRNVTPTPDML